jgi:hypothetical protein
MSKLPPKKILDFPDIRSMEDAKKLPLAVVIEKGNNVSVYRIESDDVGSYFMEMGGDPVPFIGNLLYATEKFGKPITKEEFLNASVFPAQLGVLSEISYAIYRAKFKETNK